MSEQHEPQNWFQQYVVDALKRIEQRLDRVERDNRIELAKLSDGVQSNSKEISNIKTKASMIAAAVGAIVAFVAALVQAFFHNLIS